MGASLVITTNRDDMLASQSRLERSPDLNLKAASRFGEVAVLRRSLPQRSR